jgi:hypothetical protein
MTPDQALRAIELLEWLPWIFGFQVAAFFLKE